MNGLFIFVYILTFSIIFRILIENYSKGANETNLPQHGRYERISRVHVN